MTALFETCQHARAKAWGALKGVRVFGADVWGGLVEISHNSLALFGLLVVGAALFVSSRADLRQRIETTALGWLQARQEARAEALAEAQAARGDLIPVMAEREAVLRATAADPKDLPKAQALVVTWLSRRYHVAPEPVSRIVQEAWTVGQKTGVEPTLILSVMAIESSFNPFAQSAVGAQGLMQVMTRVHDDKYEAFGGQHAAFDPVTKLKVGAQVLRDCISRAGGIESGLRLYVGAGVGGDDGGYAAKVLAEHLLLKQVLAGRNVAPNTPSTPAPVATTAMAAPAAPSASQQTTQPT